LALKRIFAALVASVSGLLGLVMVLTLLYNVAGLFKIQDGADGPMWEMVLVVLACFGLIFGAFFLSYRLFRSASAYRAVRPRI
jgi:formate hydrogenlyase subunit 3/multisubunit Na+/H+ antiporter MnhD subunit